MRSLVPSKLQPVGGLVERGNGCCRLSCAKNASHGSVRNAGFLWSRSGQQLGSEEQTCVLGSRIVGERNIASAASFLTHSPRFWLTICETGNPCGCSRHHNMGASRGRTTGSQKRTNTHQLSSSLSLAVRHWAQCCPTVSRSFIRAIQPRSHNVGVCVAVQVLADACSREGGHVNSPSGLPKPPAVARCESGMRHAVSRTQVSTGRRTKPTVLKRFESRYIRSIGSG